jgi:hypothetical protein
MNTEMTSNIKHFIIEYNFYKSSFPDKNYISANSEDLWDLTPNNVKQYTLEPWNPDINKSASLFTALAYKLDLVSREIAWNYSINKDVDENVEYFWNKGWEAGFNPTLVAQSFKLPNDITDKLLLISRTTNTKREVCDKIDKLLSELNM